MSACQGSYTKFIKRDGHAKSPSIPCEVMISTPGPDWCQFTITDGPKSMRFSVPMAEFEKLVLKMDEVMGAEGSSGLSETPVTGTSDASD